MPYKTILVHAGPDPGAPARMRLAARLALRSGAHLVGAAPTGISRYLPPQVAAAGGAALAGRFAALRRAATGSLDHFSRIAAEEGVVAAEMRLVEDEAGAGLALQARYSDLVVAGQAEPGAASPALPPDLPDYLVLACGRPVLVVPRTGATLEPGGDALVGWDGGVEAMRALDGALPLLRAARRTTVLAFAHQAPWPDQVEHPDLQLVAWLARQGVAARLERHTGSAGLGDSFLSEANDRGAGLLVMGGYGHARMRELLTGGVTATILRAMTLPVLLAH